MEELEKLQKKTKKLKKIEIILFVILIILILAIVLFRDTIAEIYWYDIVEICSNNRNPGYSSGEAVDIFNSRFTGYFGIGVDYNTAKQCIVSIRANNEIEKTYNNHIVECKTNIGDLERQKTYTIDCGYDNDGYIFQLL